MVDRIRAFIWEKGDIKLAPCISCAYKHPDKPSCEAFPKGISEKILSGENDHRERIFGDHGLRYKEVKK